MTSQQQQCHSLDYNVHISIAVAKNRPKCVNDTNTAMYFCTIHGEFFCTNCIVDHEASYRK